MTITSSIVAMSLCRKIRPHEMKIFLKKLNEKEPVKFEGLIHNFKNNHPQSYNNFIKAEYDNFKNSNINNIEMSNKDTIKH